MVTTGGSVQFLCTSYKSVSWNLDGGPLLPNTITFQDLKEPYKHWLNIHDVHLENAGTYFCYLAKELGQHQANGVLVVKGKSF